MLLTVIFIFLISRVFSSPTGTQQCMLNLPLEINTVSNDSRIDELKEKIDELKESVATILAILNSTSTNADTNNQPQEYISSPLLHSCDEVKSTWPDSVSDYYLIADSTGHARHVYCNMENTCGDKEGGWMRVGYLNMSDPSEQCPPGFRLYKENGIRACGRQDSGCQSVEFPSYGISYSQVCGRVTGYQKGSPDAVEPWPLDISGIDQAYVDGVSITRGNRPRKHVWTFMAALQENFHYANGVQECPCAPNSPVTPQSFIDGDYFCESGNPSNWDGNTLHTADPLWDGKQCGLIEKACCLATGIPWFNTAIKQPTTDYIELRVCGDQPITNEDSPVGYFEIYVK